MPAEKGLVGEVSCTSPLSSCLGDVISNVACIVVIAELVFREPNSLDTRMPTALPRTTGVRIDAAVLAKIRSGIVSAGM